MEPPGRIDVTIDVASARFAPGDDRWLREVDAFVVELRDHVPDVERRQRPVEGTKGGVGAIVLTLGSAGVFTTAVELFRSWIARDRTRAVRLSWHADGKLQGVEITGDDLDRHTLDEMLRALTTRLDQST